jgi:hypothetical protein
LNNFDIAIEIKGGMMKPYKPYVDFNKLTAKQRADLKRTLLEHKRALQAAIRVADRDLSALAKKPKKRKRKAAKR